MYSSCVHVYHSIWIMSDGKMAEWHNKMGQQQQKKEAENRQINHGKYDFLSSYTWMRTKSFEKKFFFIFSLANERNEMKYGIDRMIIWIFDGQL